MFKNATNSIFSKLTSARLSYRSDGKLILTIIDNIDRLADFSDCYDVAMANC